MGEYRTGKSFSASLLGLWIFLVFVSENPCSSSKYFLRLGNGEVVCNSYGAYDWSQSYHCYFQEYAMFYPQRYGNRHPFTCERCFDNNDWMVVCTLKERSVANVRCAYKKRWTYIRYYYHHYWTCNTFNVDTTYRMQATNRRTCSVCQSNVAIYQPSVPGVNCCDRQTSTVSDGTCCWNQNEDRCLCSQGTFCAGIVTPKPVNPVTVPPKPTPKPKKPTTIAPKKTSTLPPTTTTTTTTKPPPTTTTETTKILPAKKVCAQFRLLNGNDVNACEYPGATRIENQPRADTKSTTSCNAVFVNIMVAGKQTPAFYTSNLCHKAIQAFAAFKKKNKVPAVLNFKIDSVKVPLDVDLMFDTLEASSGSSWFYVVKAPFRSMLNYTDRCRFPACTIAKNTYEEINLSDCELVSFGSVDKRFTQRGLQRTKVKIIPNSLCRTEEVKANHPAIDGETETMCFRQVDKKNIFCNGDAGSALYCMSQAKEKVLVGVAANQKYCDQSSFVRIIPYPVDEPSRENKDFVQA